MKLLLFSLAVLIAIPCRAAVSVRAGTNISNYPNISSPSTNARYVLELPGVTNYNISHQQLKLNFTQGLATVSYVNSTTVSATNGLAHTNFVKNQDTTVSNGLVTFISIVIPRTNETVMVLQKTPNAGSYWYTGTNGVPTTNEARSGLEFNAFWRSLRMGEVAGGADIYGLVGNGSNYWNNTNIGPVTVGFGSNSYVKAAFSSVLGGSYNAILTNANQSVIGGGINNLIDTNAVNSVIAGGGRNSIRSTNTGSPSTLPIANITISGGSNNNVLGLSKWSTIGGGGDNTIIAVQEATIAGGFGNTIHPDGRMGFIGGGQNNAVGVSGGTPADSQFTSVVGGNGNIARGDGSFIGGGIQNQIFTGGDSCAVGGGQLNIIGVTPNNFSTHATISGGSSGLIQQNSHWSVIGGGLRNQILSGSTNSTISGGEDNVIEANAPFGNILGGRDNHITGTGDYSTIAGVSNEVSAPYAMAFGLLVTNVTAGSVTVSELVSYNTPAVIAGAGSGSTNYLLSVTSPKMLLGSSNVHIYGVSGTIAGKTHNWSANITNLSGDTWGISFASGTNRWKFQSWMYGTNAPAVLTNNTLLRLNGESEGTNTLITYEYFSPAL